METEKTLKRSFQVNERIREARCTVMPLVMESRVSVLCMRSLSLLFCAFFLMFCLIFSLVK